VTRRLRRSQAEVKRISRSNSGVSVRRTIRLEDAGDRAVVRDTATATLDVERCRWLSACRGRLIRASGIGRDVVAQRNAH
jgi:hypothetical protein